MADLGSAFALTLVAAASRGAFLRPFLAPLEEKFTAFVNVETREAADAIRERLLESSL